MSKLQFTRLHVNLVIIIFFCVKSALDKSSLDVRTKKNSFYLSQILEPQNDEIPRARVPDVSNGSSRPQSPLGYDQNRGPGSRYFVPLKQ